MKAKYQISNIKYQIVLFVLIALTSCQFRPDESVDFLDLSVAQNLPFRVIGQNEVDLNEGVPTNCYLPDGSRLVDFVAEEGMSELENEGVSDTVSGPNKAPKTTSTNAAEIMQSLLKYHNQNKVIEIVGTYPSINTHGDSVTLSGKVILPKGRKPKRLILVSHYTVCSNSEAPSNCFSLEGMLAPLGYGLIIPDYLGYGVTAREVHPYLVMDLTARNVLDMYLAVKPWLEAVGLEPEKPEIILMGYSQGGANTMAVERLIETEYWSDEAPQQTKIHRVFAGGGPYDVKATYEQFVNTDVASYPVAVPLVVQGMILGNNLQINIEDLVRPCIYEHLDEWINSKKYTSGQINKFIGTKVTHEILTEEAMDQRSWKVSELQKAMIENSIVSFNWMPEAAVYIAHSMDDETVSFQNASNAKARWTNSNITYNFGHYGGHVMTCLRFIYSVQSLLEQEERERSEYE